MYDNPTVGMNKDQRPNQFYDLIDPKTGYTFPANPNRVWAWAPESMQKLLDTGRIIFPNDPSKRPMFKKYKKDLKSEVNPISSLLADVGLNSEATRTIQGLFNGSYFNYSKPLSLLKTLIKNSSSTNDLIFDFFAGSGTTAQAVLELNKEDDGNRKFILVQLPEKSDTEGEAFKAGYKTIADISKERIRRVINNLDIENEKFKVKKDSELKFEDQSNIVNVTDNGFKVFKLSSSNFKIWRGNDITEENLETQLDAFTDPVREGSETENMLYELILKAGYLLTDKVELKQMDVISTSLNDRVTSFNDQTPCNYYSVNEGELIIALEEMNQQLIETIITAKPKKVITLDKLFEGNDQLKTNAVLQMRDAGIDFKTI
jgi:adenine-specific DNA-methyltransferase